ncbi:hypothetical protein Tsubulata_017271 [Turnera subulata]|uniref:Gibberellin regulated protein n=1 Tax=Turnera subulata TaxID=218843 RepID=A0A9Q0GGW5_9ROSI|nr:hypothetical protein Tsubulata_017271 [Turnera subulata]
MKLSFATLMLLSLLLISSSFLQFSMALPQTSAPAPLTKDPLQGFCDYKCNVRCAEAGYKERCLQYCDICCRDCKCVPSGPRAPKSECPCYEKKKNSHNNKPKCP